MDKTTPCTLRTGSDGTHWLDAHSDTSVSHVSELLPIAKKYNHVRSNQGRHHIQHRSVKNYSDSQKTKYFHLEDTFTLIFSQKSWLHNILKTNMSTLGTSWCTMKQTCVKVIPLGNIWTIDDSWSTTARRNWGRYLLVYWKCLVSTLNGHRELDCRFTITIWLQIMCNGLVN